MHFSYAFAEALSVKIIHYNCPQIIFVNDFLLFCLHGAYCVRFPSVSFSSHIYFILFFSWLLHVFIYLFFYFSACRRVLGRKSNKRVNEWVNNCRHAMLFILNLINDDFYLWMRGRASGIRSHKSALGHSHKVAQSSTVSLSVEILG